MKLEQPEPTTTHAYGVSGMVFAANFRKPGASQIIYLLYCVHALSRVSQSQLFTIHALASSDVLQKPC